MNSDDLPSLGGRAAAADDPPPVPAAVTLPAPASIARRVRRTLRRTKGADPAQALALQAEILNALFSDLIINGVEGTRLDEVFGLALALRAQKQCRQTLEALEFINASRDSLRGKK